MCEQCNKWYASLPDREDKHGIKRVPLRDTLTDVEIAKYRRAKMITDPRKLSAMLPAYIKTHMRNVAPPKPFIFEANRPPKFPAWTTHSGMAEVDLRKFPAFQTDNLKLYIDDFNLLNGLRA